MAKRVVKLADGTWGLGSVRQRGGTWQVRWREGRERKSSSGHLSRAEAVEELEKIRARLSLGQPGVEPLAVPAAPAPRGRAFEDLVEDWIEYRRAHDITSADEDRARWDKHLTAPLATQTIDEVTPRFVRHLAQELVKPSPGAKKRAVSGPTAHRCLTLLSAFYTWANGEELVSGNPARLALTDKTTKGLLASKHEGRAKPYLKSWASVDLLYRALRDEDPAVAIAYYLSARAGLRPGEALALQWGDVDFDAGQITVERQVRHGRTGTTKSGKTRHPPLVGELASELAAWRKRQDRAEPGDLVCPPPRPVKKNGTLGRPLGRHLGAKSVRDAWAKALKTTGIKRASVYCYSRHTYASLVGLSGAVSAWRLQEILGHEDISTTQRYVSLAGQALSPDELRALGG